MEESVILIGKKPMKNYMLALQTLARKSKEITVKARGNSIVKAINLAEFAKRVLNANYTIEIKTEELMSKDESRKNFVTAVVIKIKTS